MIEYTDPDLKAITVAERWKDQYKNRATSEWRDTIRSSSEDIYNKLVALGAEPDPEDIEDIIGNDSWNRTECDECGVENAPVAVIQQDYDAGDIQLCLMCLRKISNELWSTFYE